MGAETNDQSAGKRSKISKTIRHLERRNKELLMRVKELELKRGGGREQREGKKEDHELSEESANIVAAVKDMYGEIDAAYDLKEALEIDLAATQKTLAEEKALRARLEARISLLKEKAAFADELREDISFVEEEQNKTFRRLKEAKSELGRVTEERDGLAEQKAADETRIEELQAERTQLELQVLNLKERLAEMVSMFGTKRTSST